jgi:hypothetical protein
MRDPMKSMRKRTDDVEKVISPTMDARSAEKRRTVLDRSIAYTRQAGPLELTAAFALAVFVGFVQDLLAVFPPLAWLDALTPFDEGILGSIPWIVVLEFLRRLLGIDVIERLRETLGRVPSPILVAIMSSLWAALGAGDLSVSLPVVGLVTLPWQFLDQYVLGLPTLLVGFELMSRLGHQHPMHVNADAPLPRVEDKKQS